MTTTPASTPASNTYASKTAPSKSRILVGAPALVAATLATWWVSLGWDTEYDYDPVTQHYSGPYQAYQVIGCVLALIAIAVAGGLLARPWLPVLVMTPTFALAWSAQAAGQENGDGLWVIGATLILVGMAAGTSILGFGAHLVRKALAT